MADYSYQTHSANQILENCQKPGVLAAVLAATPNAGKTTISHIVISKYLKQHPNAHVLVLTHGQNILKNQYIESLKNPNVEIDFTFGSFSDLNNAQVQIGLPQSINRYPFDSVDLLVVDECHEFYLKPMVQGIVNKLKPKHQVLLTGSPSIFNKLKEEGKKYEITYISGEELLKNDVFSNVEMDVVSINFKNNTTDCIKKMLDHAKVKGKDLSKIMVAVKTINEAKNVGYYLKSIGRNVAISNSKNDKNNIMIKDFKNGDYDTLIVVMRGILGFSDNYITGLFDLRCSESVDISNQLFARTLRKHPNNIEKFYYRCGKKGYDFNDQVIMLHKIKSLMNKNIFKNYNGENMTVRVS